MIRTRGASPRRADARLGSAHARNYRGCRQIEAVNATVLPRGTLKINIVWSKRKTVWMKRRTTLESDSMDSNKFCHPAHDNEQPLQQNNSSIATHREAAAAAAAAFCMHINTHQVWHTYRVIELLPGPRATRLWKNKWRQTEKKSEKKTNTRKKGLCGIWNVDLKSTAKYSHMPNHRVSYIFTLKLTRIYTVSYTHLTLPTIYSV